MMLLELLQKLQELQELQELPERQHQISRRCHSMLAEGTAPCARNSMMQVARCWSGLHSERSHWNSWVQNS